MKQSIKFSLFPRKNANGTMADCLPIRIRVSFAGIRAELRIGYSIEPEKWDSSNEKVKSNCKNKFGQSSADINKAISRARGVIDEVFTRFEYIEKKIPSKQEFEESFYSIFNPEKFRKNDNEAPASFFSLFEEFVTKEGRNRSWEKTTYTKFNAVLFHLRNFCPNLQFENLTEDLLSRFVQYQNNLKMPRRKIGGEFIEQIGMRNTTIAKNIDYVKWFLRWASKHGYYTGNLHETFKPKLKGTDGKSKEVIHFTWDELLHLYYFKIPPKNKHLESVRDVICFYCFSSLRHSDGLKLTKSDVKENHIQVVTKKTVEALYIDLNKYSKAILDKYKDIPLPGNKALPVMSNVNMNVYLKELCKLAGIDTPERIVYFKGNKRIEEIRPKYELITTHCGRRTFIVNSLYLGIPAEVVMKWTGHEDYDSMKPYIKIVDPLKAKEMNKFNQ